MSYCLRLTPRDIPKSHLECPKQVSGKSGSVRIPLGVLDLPKPGDFCRQSAHPCNCRPSIHEIVASLDPKLLEDNAALRRILPLRVETAWSDKPSPQCSQGLPQEPLLPRNQELLCGAFRSRYTARLVRVAHNN